MPTKTDRILGRLPSIYKALPPPSALYSVADAFGDELLKAENSLAALMLAHWVDHADKGAEFIDDLRRIGALYGLSPRPDETVEEFRAHLKRYVRIFLDGPSTVQGVLRVTAESPRSEKPFSSTSTSTTSSPMHNPTTTAVPR